MEDERFNLGKITLRAEKSGGSCAGCFFYKNKEYPCSNQEIRELIKHCNWRVFKECPEIKKATNTVLKKRPLNMIDELKKYFKETPKEKVLKDWEATKEFDNIPQKNCVAGASYSDCEIHADNIDGCLGCGNFQIQTD